MDQRPLTRALVVLTFTTGLIDAVSYLGLGRVFTANMTGNVVLFGFGLAGTSGLPVLAPLVSFGGFLFGAILGGGAAQRSRSDGAVHAAYAFAAEAALLSAVAVVAAFASVRAGTASGYIVIALLAFAMGIRNATVRRLAVQDLTTTVLTMTVTGLAADSPFAGGTGKGSRRRILAVGAMLTGALAGALLLKTSVALPLALAAGLAPFACFASRSTARSSALH
ncbi:MAG TPA: YoaK family protein [Thermoleophilaceae bacterium]|jgi:uncharacterized membrane protein YoaK (UPF0700 family)|nr:YoaK family protein [Thermoleophilaceae bacterium]